MKNYITVTRGISGWFAVELYWDKEINMWAPWTTGFGRYPDEKDAVAEGKAWALADEMEFKYEPTSL